MTALKFANVERIHKKGGQHIYAARLFSLTMFSISITPTQSPYLHNPFFLPLNLQH
jgi:hypothetical protein